MNLYRWRTSPHISVDAFPSVPDAVVGCIEDLDLWCLELLEEAEDAVEDVAAAAAAGDLVTCDEGGRILTVDLDGHVIGLRAWVVPSTFFGDGTVVGMS